MPIEIPTGVTCPVPLIGARSIGITFPGGARIGAMTDKLYATEAEVARSLLGYAQLVLAPLKPIFDIVATVLAIVKILEAVATLNPVKIGQEIAAAGKQFAAMAQLIPQVSGPLMIAHVLDLVIVVLRGFLTELQQIAVKNQEIDALALKIIGDSDPLQAIVACARKLNQARMCAIDESMGPLEPIFELLNIFMKLLGLPPVAPTGPLGHDVFGAVHRLQDLIGVLANIRKSLAIPTLSFTPRC